MRILTLFVLFAALSAAATIHGTVNDPQGKPVPAAILRLDTGAETATDAEGSYLFEEVETGNHLLTAQSVGFFDLKQPVAMMDSDVTVNLTFALLETATQSVTVTADSDSTPQLPDPAGRVFLRDELLDTNPGRPGPLASIPGLPVETASGGIKAPQYFAPGVAGDHGEPIAQHLDVGGVLVGNNLSANAHGNGYSDPNFLIGAGVESVSVDGGAFNIREGNHAVNLATAWSLRPRLEPFVTFTGDQRDGDLTAGWSPFRPETRAWFAMEVGWGNGLLDVPEHRRQYKLNGYRVFERGSHEITMFGAAYYGRSNIPGLIPIDVSVPGDTIDPRQRDETHTAELVVTDHWHVDTTTDVWFSAWFRTYSLALYSNFGDGLIRQSEFRTVTGGSQEYTKRFSRALHIMAGLDYLRDAPRRLDLDHYDSTSPDIYGPFEKVTSDNVTLESVSPYFSADGRLTSWLNYNLGWRHDEILFEDQNLLNPAESLHRWEAVESPRATLTFVPKETSFAPKVSLSFGQAFFTNDPRMGTGTERGSLVSRAHALQLVASKTVAGTEFRVTAGRSTHEQSLAKIDPDTGLQMDQGPSRNRFVTFAAIRRYSRGLLEASFSKADARDLLLGSPLPEAPRLIADALGTVDRLPFRLRARAEYEYVGAKPLGDGFVGVPVEEFRGSLARSFFNERLDAGLHFTLASGWTGQTTEVIALPGDSEATERVVGVRQPSSAGISLTYRFRP